jgi:glucose/arabinose dehydrogenase
MRAARSILLGLAHLAVLASLSSATGARAQSPPFTVGGDPRVDPADFEITVFASGLDSPLPMQRLEDGSLLVGTSGGVLRLVDADDDGVADGPGTLVFTGGAGLATGLRTSGSLVFVARSETVFVLRRGALPSDPLTVETSFDIEIPLPWSHISHTLAVRQTAPGVTELWFNVGSKEDAAETVETVPVSGAVSGTVNADSIHRVVVDDTGPSVVVSGLTEVATGVRNAFGMAFHPTTGDLWFEDNSMDGDTAPYELSVDELNTIAAADLAGAVEDFGFPSHYFAYRTDAEVGSGGIVPVVRFQPVPPPDGSESEGPAEIAFAPPGFPPGLRTGVFVGFHGAFSATGVANADNPVVYVDLDTGEYFHFIANTEPLVGHPDGLLASGDALFVSDFGGFSAGAGAIYRIRALPPAVPGLAPFTGIALGTVLAAAGVARLTRARRPGLRLPG